MSGCSRDSLAEFSSADEVADLPELHQTSISSGLARLFGTTSNPRVRIVDANAEQPEEGQPTPLIDAVDQGHLKHGARVYNARCAGCHGVAGDGNGPAGEYLRPRPRDYRNGIFKFTSTPYGYKPARHDLVRIIRRGAKGTSMPAFPWMSDEDLNAVIDYVIFLSQRGEVERYAAMMSDEYEEDEAIDFVEFTDGIESAINRWESAGSAVVMPVSAEPVFAEDSVTAGRKLFLSQGCAQCHGKDGKGQIEWLNPEFLARQESLPEAEREKINTDAWNEPAPAADLTAKMLHGGRRPIDIYRRIYTGINGTPMPAFDGAFASEPEKLWHLVHYVRHIIEGGDPIAGIASLPPVAQEPEPKSVDAVDADASEATLPDASIGASTVDLTVGEPAGESPNGNQSEIEKPSEDRGELEAQDETRDEGTDANETPQETSSELVPTSCSSSVQSETHG